MCKAVNEISSNETRAKFSLSSTATTVEIKSETAAAATIEKNKTIAKTNKVKKTLSKTSHPKQLAKKINKIQTKPIESNEQEEKVFKNTTTTTTTTSSSSAELTICKTTNIIEEDSNIEIHEENEEIHVKIYKELLSEKDLEKYKIADEINEILEIIQADKFGSGEKPLRELATIGFLLQSGITVSEITHLYNADSFPALKNPESQSALVQLVEREGHAQLISEVITEETILDEASLAATVGFRAFLRMIEQQHITIEEVIPNFRHEDFIAQEWKVSEAKEKIVVESSSERCFTESKKILSSG